MTMAESSSTFPPAFSPSPTQSRDRARARALSGIPRFYSPYLHLAATTGVGVATLVVALQPFQGHARPSSRAVET
jgi:hypothetical protein